MMRRLAVVLLAVLLALMTALAAGQLGGENDQPDMMMAPSSMEPMPCDTEAMATDSRARDNNEAAMENEDSELPGARRIMLKKKKAKPQGENATNATTMNTPPNATAANATTDAPPNGSAPIGDNNDIMGGRRLLADE